MPFTPLHFGPSACVTLPLQKYIDLPVFVLVSVVIDLEPLAVMVFGLNYPFHGYCHTFLIGSFVGVAWAIVAYTGRDILRKTMNFFRLEYKTTFRKAVFSGVLGAWFHVLLDAPIYSDIRPFYPFTANPLYGIISRSAMCNICLISFVPATILYLIAAESFRKKREI